ncbi:MAG: hypothetical protein KDE63_09865, partial [Novosphingobium sp.]|nr:hypothetical protein [Novosphingobium sp.]
MTRSFRGDDSAAIAPLYALALFALIGAGGIAFDYARLAAMDSELQSAADQAALAAASQLDGEDDAKLDAEGAARSFFATAGYNTTLFANDGQNKQIGDLDIEVNVVFYENRADAEADTNSFSTASTSTGETDADAHFVRVTVENRKAIYALTPVVGAFEGEVDAHATAGLGSAVCKVPPIMICHPNPSTTINWDNAKGMGVLATGHSPGNSSNQGGNSGSDTAPGSGNWSPGNFGFLQINDSGDNTSRNAALLKALAFDNPPLDCVPVGENKVSTGNPQGLYDAINTRFGIYDFPSNGGNTLAPCEGGACTAAPNVIMDLQRNGNGNNSCKLKASNNSNGNGNSKGYGMPANAFKPVYKAGYTNQTLFDDDGVYDRIGLPRDNCHYTTYDETGGTGTDGLCSGSRFGDKLWARADYWAKVHPGVTKPSGWDIMTRYETYEYELDHGLAQTSTCGVTGERTRRVLSVAVVTNCNELNGTSKPVDIDEFVDVFLVEPAIDATNRYNPYKDSIYFEIIGKSKTAGGYTYGVQTVRR